LFHFLIIIFLNNFLLNQFSFFISPFNKKIYLSSNLFFIVMLILIFLIIIFILDHPSNKKF